jgi:transcriptional regulator with XRE-family HTH domain
MKISLKERKKVRRELATRLKTLRKAKGVTLQEVCRACRMDKRTLKRLEQAKGKGEPRFLTLWKIFKYYGVNPLTAPPRDDTRPQGRLPKRK